MSASHSNSVALVEVGPRDGFQAIGPFIPTTQKIQIIRALAASGVTRIEAGSFVSPTALPQMKDVREVLAACQGSAQLCVLVPNFKGAALAIEAGIQNLVYVTSVSETHNSKNVRQSVAQSIADFQRILRDLRPAGRVRLNLATAFDCPFEGRIPAENTLALIDQVRGFSQNVEICLCDTTGKAVPVLVSDLFARGSDRFGDQTWAYHAHDTYGLGLATTMAAYNAGVRVFDASVAGLGGCPFAPGATGNVATEDVVFMFEKSGIGTGVRMARLIEAAQLAACLEGAQIGGHIRGIAVQRTLAKTGSGTARDELIDG